MGTPGTPRGNFVVGKLDGGVFPVPATAAFALVTGIASDKMANTAIKGRDMNLSVGDPILGPPRW
jgi:hypothetical protein